MNSATDYPFFDGPKPRIIGHRGAMGTAPENTALSFHKAFADGASLVEFDVRQSLDGEVIIIHDATLDRTTDGSGEVTGYPLKDLKALDGGYRFSLDGGITHPFRGQRVKVATLRDFFATFPGSKAIIEIKHFSPSIVQRTLDLTREFHADNRVLLATEEDRIMVAVRDELKRRGLAIATGFSYGEVAAFIGWVRTGMHDSFAPAGQAFQIPCEYQSVTLVSSETVSAAHSLGVEVFVWTVNDPREMERLLALDVDGIITDYPERMKALTY